MAASYPIVLDVSRLTAVIVGGGAVAVRKAEGLLAAGIGRVRCVAPRIAPEMPGEVQRIETAFEPAHIDGADLVFAATDSAAVNEQVVCEAHARGAWVNRTDADGASEPGDFAVPALLRQGALTIAVSAGGSPALAARVRDAIGKGLDPTYARLADAMQELRPWVQSHPNLDTARRQAIFRVLASEAAMGVLNAGDTAALKRWLADQFEELGAIL